MFDADKLAQRADALRDSMAARIHDLACPGEEECEGLTERDYADADRMITAYAEQKTAVMVRFHGAGSGFRTTEGHADDPLYCGPCKEISSALADPVMREVVQGAFDRGEEA